MLTQGLAIARWMLRLSAPAILAANLGVLALGDLRHPQASRGSRGVEVRLSSPGSEWINAESGRVTVRLQPDIPNSALEGDASERVLVVRRVSIAGRYETVETRPAP